jgi:tRNA/rRNA methyltransferase
MTTLLDRMRIVMCATSHPGNIGAAARAMNTMGVSQLVLVAPRLFPHEEATARASGATAVLDAVRVVDTLDDALAGCAASIGFSARPREFAGSVLPVRAAAAYALRHAGEGDVALVFGSEMSGLSNDELARCQVIATIATNPHYSSLNVAAAVQLACYELRVAAHGDTVWTAPRFPAASSDEIARLFAHAETTLAGMKFFDPSHPRRLLPRLRRLFARAGLEKEEVNILRGILARVDELIARDA